MATAIKTVKGEVEQQSAAADLYRTSGRRLVVRIVA
jgi:hypothetical protein